VEVAEEEELPIIEFNFEIPLLYFRFPSGFGRVKVTVVVPPSEENEAGRINICWEKVNEYSTPSSTQPPSTPPSPAAAAAVATLTAATAAYTELTRQTAGHTLFLAPALAPSSSSERYRTPPLITVRSPLPRRQRRDTFFAEESSTSQYGELLQRPTSSSPRTASGSMQRIPVHRTTPIVVDRVRSPPVDALLAPRGHP